MKIGRYEVLAHASGDHVHGFKGSAHLTWEEGNATLEKMLYFDASLPNLGAAIEHAYEQVQVRVQNGDL